MRRSIARVDDVEISGTLGTTYATPRRMNIFWDNPAEYGTVGKYDYYSKRLISNIIIYSIIYTRQEKLGNEARFPNVNTTVHCSICN